MAPTAAEARLKTNDLLRKLTVQVNEALIPENDLPFASGWQILHCITELHRIREELLVLVDDDLFTEEAVGPRSFRQARDLLDLCVREASVLEQLKLMNDGEVTADVILGDTGDMSSAPSEFLETTDSDEIASIGSSEANDVGLDSSHSPTLTPSIIGTGSGKLHATSGSHFLFQWARPTGFNNELSTEQSKALVGNATVLRIGSDCIAVGTSRGLVLCFEMSSQLKMTLRIPDTELERHPVSALGFSQDGKVVAAGFRDGSFALWDLSSSKLLRFVAPASVPSPASSHQRGCSVLHITFLGSSSELLTADDRGVVIHHSLSRAPMLIGDKRARIHGASPDGRAAIVPTTIFGLSASSDWSSDPWTEEFGLFALCTPYKLAVMSLRPELATHYKLVWNQDTRAPKGHSGTVLPIHEVGDTASVPLARSNDQDEDVSPFSCMAWAPMDNPKNSTRSQSFANTHRLLACSRGTTLNLIQVRPVNKMSAQGTTARGVTGFRAVLHEGWTSPATIVGLWFLDKDHILVADSTEMFHVFDAASLVVAGSENVSGIRFHSQDFFRTTLEAMGKHPAVTYSHTIAAHRGKVLGLTIDGVVFGGLVPWRTRINRLLGERLWAETLEFAVSLISRPNLIGLFSATADSVATKESVADFTAQKLIRFVRGTVALHVGPQHAGRGDKPVGPIEPSIAEIIQIAIKSALALGREDTIFADIFDIFFESGLSDAFIDALHPFIVQDSLATAQLSATFLNVLVTSRVARGSFFELEEDLLHLDIGPLNTDLVVNVCRAQRLWRGLVHVHNRQLRDHISPLVDLLRLLESRLTAINKDPSTVPDATEDDCYLVYVYLTYILTGKTFPRGFMEDASKSLVAKSNCWNFLLSATYVAWPPLHVQGPVVGLDRRVRIGHEPFPYLSMLVQYDDTAFFGMLTAAFEDVALSGELWIKPLSDGGLGSTEPALFGHGLDITRQFILDTLFSLLLPEYAEGIVAIPKSLADFTRDSHRFDESAKMQFVCFAVRALQRYSTFVAYDNHTCRLLLRLLCASKDPRTEALRESCVTDVVRRDINWLGSESSVADFDVDVEMLKQAGFYRAAESLAEGRGRWDHVVDCYFLDRKRRHEALALISRVLRSMGTDTRYRDSILARLVEYAPELAATDATGTARLVDSYAADSHLAITIQIEDPNVRLAYLAAIVGPPTFGHSTLSHALYESYIDLLCRLQPASVLEYLQTLSAAFPERPFSSSKVLDSCISHQVVLAAAWVLEASGDAFGALNLITASMKETFFGCIEAFNVIRHLKKGKVAYEDAAAVAEIYGNSEFGRTRARFEASAMDLVNKLQAGLGLCQRATKLLSPMDRRLLWFTILEFLMELRENLSDHFYERAVDPDLGGLLRSLLVTALNGMVGHMSLPLVLEEIVRKHSDASIGDYRDILEAFMNMYSYERGLLEASRRLLADDLFQGEGLLLKGLKQGQRLRPVR